MKLPVKRTQRRGTVLLMIVGLLSMLFIVISAYIVLARFDRLTMRMSDRGEKVTEAIAALQDLVEAQIRGSGGPDAVAGANYVHLPGYYEGAYIAASEPVRDPNASSGNILPGRYQYRPTALTPTQVNPLRLHNLLLDANGQNGVVWNPWNGFTIGSGAPDHQDMQAALEQTITDAAATGIPDAAFGMSGMGTELANAIVGRSVRANGLDISQLDPTASDPNIAIAAQRWRRFAEEGDFVAPVRVEAHGGMVLVADPVALPVGDPNHAWNSQFLQEMFNWVRNPKEGTSYRLDLSRLEHQKLLRDLFTQRGSVEPGLRRRGGLLDAPRAGDTFLPPALATLTAEFPNTLPPYYGNLKKDTWQRFNLTNANEWEAWRQAVTVDPTTYARFHRQGGSDPRGSVIARRWLTTQSNSDELARIRSTDPNKPATNTDMGLEAGALKFPLGRLAECFYPPNDQYAGEFNPTKGQPILRELANYYYEMLVDFSKTNGTLDQQPVSARRQAFMFAANTGSFAAPRAVRNRAVDQVYVTDSNDPLNGVVRYFGYAPQPFITQVIAYGKGRDPNDPNTGTDPERIALAVELFIPEEPDPNWVPDPEQKFTAEPTAHLALPLNQFAITINNQDPQTVIGLGTVTGNASNRVHGRNFVSFLVRDRTENSGFESLYPGRAAGMIDHRVKTISDPNSQPPNIGKRMIEVKLWRTGAELRWPPTDSNEICLVDHMQLRLDFTSAQEEKDWVFSQHRDPSRTAMFAGASSPNPARWNMVIAEDRNTDVVYVSGGNVADGVRESVDTEAVVTRSPFDPSTVTSTKLVKAFAPTIPLYTMNAGAELSNRPIHGARRPASLPTVGFLAFIPRYSHMTIAGSMVQRRVLSELLVDPALDQAAERRVDFARMPFFDNTLDVREDSTFKDAFNADRPELRPLGRVPWGQFVFDYFTTLTYKDPNVVEPEAVDPYRVAGRINVNVAPWYVMAGLPVIGPSKQSGANFGNLAEVYDPSLSNPNGSIASPAFWSKKSGVLVGQDSIGRVRFIGEVDDRLVAPDKVGTYSGGWWRLGPDLAIAAAAYRDRVQYVRDTDTNSRFEAAFERNVGTAQYRDTSLYGSVRRGAGGGWGAQNPAKTGFLTLGELANVVGFDSYPKKSISHSDPESPVVQLDYYKSISLLALLDTHFLTTRSNTFTIYATLHDRKNPQASVRSQVTVDRTNLLPRLVETTAKGKTYYSTLVNTGQAELLGQREVSYLNARFDE